jgi:hypothetical protein
MPEEAEATPAPQQAVAQASDAKATATGTAKASDELSMDDLEAVAGGRIRATDKDGLERG